VPTHPHQGAHPVMWEGVFGVTVMGESGVCVWMGRKEVLCKLFR
jgi:hypothetical protein